MPTQQCDGTTLGSLTSERVAKEKAAIAMIVQDISTWLDAVNNQMSNLQSKITPVLSIANEIAVDPTVPLVQYAGSSMLYDELHRISCRLYDITSEIEHLSGRVEL